MKKTLSMGAFTELDEREVMETEGGFLQGFFNLICGATAAEKRANEVYETGKAAVKQSLIDNNKTPNDIPTSQAIFWGLDKDPDFKLWT